MDKGAESNEVREWRRHTLSVMVVLLILSLSAAGYFAYRANHAVLSTEEEIAGLVKTIGKTVDLPENEIPTLATVTNKDKLDDQPFFRRVQNGDKILIYPRAGRAVLYRPNIKKVLDMTTVDIEKSSVDGQAIQSVSQGSSLVAADHFSVMFYNGTTDPASVYPIIGQVALKFPSFKNDGSQAAVRNNYIGTLVIDLTGANKARADEIAAAIGGTVSAAIPAGEIRPTADVLVIVGKAPDLTAP